MSYFSHQELRDTKNKVYRVWTHKTVKHLVGGIVDIGDGFLDWHVAPTEWAPPGRYRVVQMERNFWVTEWEGPIPDDSREAVVFVEGGIALGPRAAGAGPHHRSHLGD